MARNHYRRRPKPARLPGLDRARQHIEEARQLSVDLGGTDEDVKDYFFSLDPHELHPIMQEYGRRFGSKACEYAQQTFPAWRSRRRKMSGLVASRLFKLLPAFMPIQQKYALVKSLWEKKCPGSTKTFWVGSRASTEELRGTARDYLQKVVTDYSIPEEISRRFEWLAGQDVQLQQSLYNYFLQLHREVVTSAADERLPQFLARLRSLDDISGQLRQTIEIGNHRLEIIFHQSASGVTEHEPVAPRRTSQNAIAGQSGTGCVVMLLIILGVVLTNV
jgi:hypothetical protein